MARIIKPTEPPPILEEYDQLEIANDATYIREHLLKLARQLRQDPAPPNCRHNKIQAAYRHKVGTASATGTYYYVPEINLVGLWLHNAGFIMGNNARIYALDKVVVICEDSRNIKSAPMLNLYKH